MYLYICILSQIFDHLHFTTNRIQHPPSSSSSTEQEASGSHETIDTINTINLIKRLHCHDIWFDPSIHPPSAKEIHNNIWWRQKYNIHKSNTLTTAITKDINNHNCLFSVIQSHANIPLSDIRVWMQQINDGE